MLIATCVAFAPALRAGFVDWDDGILVTNNPLVATGSGISVWQAWAEPYAGLYTPLTFLLHATVAAATAAIGSPMHPLAFHLANLFLHWVGGVLLWRWLAGLCGQNDAALAAAMIWLLHPLQAEPVTWVSGANGVLAGVLALAALLLASMGVSQSGWRYLLWLTAATLTFAASLAAKPACLLLPGVLIVTHRLLLRRPWTETLVLAGVWAAAAMPFLYIAFDTQTNGILEGDLPAGQRCLIVAHALGFYLSKAVWPTGLAADYGLAPHIVLATRLWIGPAVIAGLGAVATTILAKRRPWLLAGATVFVLALVPVLGIVPFYYQSFSIVADRYAYFALVGMAIVLAFALRPLSRSTLAMATTPLCLLLAIVTFCQSSTWHDTDRLFARAMAVNPAGLEANYHAAEVAQRTGDLPSQAAAQARIVDFRPFDADAKAQLGILLHRLGRDDEAFERLNQAIHQQPRNAGNLAKLGIVLADVGQTNLARQAFEAAVAINPQQPDATTGLAGLNAASHQSPAPVASQPSGR